MNHQDIREDGHRDVPGSDGVTGQQQHAGDDVHGQVGQGGCLEQPLIVEGSADQLGFEQQQCHQKKADGDAVVVVDAEQARALVVPCCGWRRRHGDSLISATSKRIQAVIIACQRPR